MKLSDLVHFKNQLDLLSSAEAKRIAGMELDKVTYLMSQYTNFDDTAKQLNQEIESVSRAFDQFESTIDQLKKQVNKQISENEKERFVASYTLYEGMMRNETTEYILDRRMLLPPEVDHSLQARLHLYADWKYPAMIIRPGREDFIKDMVSFDPLYLIDQNYELLEPAVEHFPEAYQNRLCKYTVNEHDEELLAKVPAEQFGLCFVYNFFNFRPFEVLRKYLEEIYTKLRPGGVLIMTFNDCDRGSAVALAESFFCCYTPGYLVREMATNIGYQIEFSWNDLGPSTWLELRKPGQLESIRGGQTLAKIVSK